MMRNVGTGRASMRGFWVISALLSACGGTGSSEHGGQVRSKIINGKEVSQPQDLGLVHVLSSTSQGTGSGLLLTNEWTLTDAHVLDHTLCRSELPNELLDGNTRRTCRFPPNVQSVALGNIGTSVPQPALRVSAHPAYAARLVETDLSGPIVDAALIRTAPFAVSVPPRSINSAQDPTSLVGSPIFCFGYGRSTIAIPQNDVRRGFGTARFGTSAITASDATHLFFVPDGATGQTPIQGDSGGPCTLTDPATDLPGSLTLIEGLVRTADTKGVGGGSLTHAAAFAAWANLVMTSVEDMNYDWDGDGTPDALFWFKSGSNLVLKWQDGGQGGALDTWASIPLSQLGDLANFHSAVGDYNADGVLDFVAVTATATLYRMGPTCDGCSSTVGTAPLRATKDRIVYTEERDGIAPDDIVVLDDQGREWVHYGVRGLNPLRPAAFEARASVLVDIDADGVPERVAYGREASDPGKVKIRAYFDDGTINTGDTRSDEIIDFTQDPQMLAGDFNGDGFGDVALYTKTHEWTGTAFADFENVWYYASNHDGFPEYQRTVLRDDLTFINAQDFFSKKVRYLEVTDFSPATAAQDLVVVRLDNSGSLFEGRQGVWNGLNSGLGKSQVSPLGGLPTVSARDGRLLTLTGKGRGTYNAPYTELKLTSKSANAKIQVYDAGTTGAQDSLDEAVDTCFQVYDDPCGDGQNSCGLGDPQLLQNAVLNGTGTADESWSALLDGSSTARVGLNGNFNYRVVAYLSKTGQCSLSRDQAIEEAKSSAVGGWNGFKVRGSGFLSYQFGELQVIASNLKTATGNWSTSAADWLRLSDYDNSFQFYFNVSDAVLLPQSDADDADIRLAEADADYLLDADAPGDSVGANDLVSFQLVNPSSVAVTLDRTDEIGTVTGSVGSPTVSDPSGDFNGAGTSADLERYQVKESDEVPGRWSWQWSGVFVHNNVHMFAPQASPVTHEVFGAPQDPPLLTAARPAVEWAALSDYAPALPLVLGSLDSASVKQGQSVVLASVSSVSALLNRAPASAWEQLEQTQATAKLNAWRAGLQGEHFGEALVQAARVSVRSLLEQADVALRGPRALVSAATVNRLNVLLGAANKGQVTYFRPGVPLVPDLGLDLDDDGLLGIEDNCPPIANPDQRDSNADGVGDACAVHAQVRCVLPEGNNRFRAYLTYDNPLEFRSIALGAANRFSPGQADRGQPREFRQGSANAAFALEFSGSETLTWSLDGGSLVINSSLPKCAGDELLQVPGHSNTVLFARDSLTIQDGAVVESTPVGVELLSNGWAEVGAQALVPALSARGNATLRSYSVVAGPLVTGGSISLQAGAAVSGAQLPGSYVPTHELSLSVAFPGTTAGSVTVDSGSSLPLAPGAYGNVAVRGTLILSSGAYYFDSLSADVGATLRFSTGSTTPVVIYVKRDLTWRATTATGGPPLLLADLGTSDAFVESPVRGNILAPQAKLVLGNQSGTHVGRFFARAIEVRSGARVRYSE